ncbi:hypothetical protein [Photobacterium leiognathi]|uniref:hypothetical protein n=1 Tax=Photobacterium leiognathi TaxID=553611 RepID=UPI003AF3AFE2
MSRPIIFVSHAAVDSEIAGIFKADVEKNFLGMCQLFVSSDLGSIQGGVEWIQNIKTNLSNAVISIGLYSPVALTRPWIYAEFGAGWIRNIPTITLCHSGLKKDDLPVPLSHFQALDLIDELHLKHLYEQISKAIDCQLPAINYEEEALRYKNVTEKYRIERTIIEWFSHLSQWNPEFEGIYHGNDGIEILIPSQFEAPFFNFKREIESLKHLRFEPRGMAMGTRVGAQATVWNVFKGENFEALKQIVNR